MGAIVLSSRWWETTKGGGADVGAIVGGGLGGDGVGMSAESRSRMM